MSLVASSKGGDYDPVPAGTHHGICIGLIDLGYQHNQTFGKWQPKVAIMWELPRVRIEIDGEDLPRVISRIFTNSLNEKAALFQILTSWRGRGFTPAELDAFDLRAVLGANCLLSITHETRNNKTYANVTAVSSLMAGSTKLQPATIPFSYDIDNDGTIPESVPEWMKEMIGRSREHTDAPIDPPPYEGGDEEEPVRAIACPHDDVPF